MKRILSIMTILAVTVAFGVIPAGAQMMGGNNMQNQKMMGNGNSNNGTMMNDSTATEFNTDFVKMMQKSTSDNTAMTADLNQLNEDFQRLMTIDDMKTLKAAMQKDIKRMDELTKEMNQESALQMQMNAMMASGGMHNMMNNRKMGQGMMRGTQNNMQTSPAGSPGNDVKSPGDK